MVEEIRPLKDNPERLASPMEFSVNLSKIPAEHIPANMQEWIARLPETIHFDSPITLIVGDNGSGKSQFARALVAKMGEARESTVESGRGNPLFLDNTEPAFVLKDAIQLRYPRKGKILAASLRGDEIAHAAEQWRKNQVAVRTELSQMGKAHSRENASTKEKRAQLGSYVADTSNSIGSSRQVFEKALANGIDQRITSHINRIFGKGNKIDGDVVVIFDEPEYGLSPQRQLSLPFSIASHFGEESILIVPTNNLVLFDSDLPRLDLSRPERGVHRPSEYGEGGIIKIERK